MNKKHLIVISLLIFGYNYSIYSMNEQGQAKQFHQNIMAQYPQHVDNNDDYTALYKKIGPKTSEKKRAESGQDHNSWHISSVSIGDTNLQLTSKNSYKFNDITINILVPEDFSENKSLTISTEQDVGYNIRLFPNLEYIYNVFLPGINSQMTLEKCFDQNKCCIKEKIIFTGILQMTSGERAQLIIEITNEAPKPATLTGIEFILNKTKKKTFVFFDISYEDKEVSVPNPVEYKHTNVSTKQPIYCFKDKRMWECNKADVYSYFSSPEIRKSWVDNENNEFYDITKRHIVTFPSCSTGAVLKPYTPATFLITDNLDSCYELDDFWDNIFGETIDLSVQNKYIYSADDTLYATRIKQIKLKELFSNKKQTADIIVQVEQPTLNVHSNTCVVGGHTSWPNGLYERVYTPDSIIWRNIKGKQERTFEKNDEMLNEGFNVNWPEQQLTLTKSGNWCHAANSLFPSYEAKFGFLNSHGLQNLPLYGKLTSLNLSRLKLYKDTNFNKLFEALSKLTLLIRLDFSHNNPLNLDREMKGDLSAFCNNCDSGPLVPTKCLCDTFDYYIGLANAIAALSKLKELHIQGLWLQPQAKLGSGYTSTRDGLNHASDEVKIIRKIIKHRDQNGLPNLINNIKNLTSLVELSVDGIPVSDTSNWNNKTLLQKCIDYLKPILESGKSIDLFNHEELKLISDFVASTIATHESLKKVNVYAPKGNCNDYFSKIFTDALRSKKPQLSIDSKVLK